MPKFVTPPALPALAVARASIPATWPWLHLLRAIERCRRARRQRADLHLLDHRDLRDLGIDRSELASYDAEAAGAALLTRRRVARGVGAGHGSE